MSLRRRPPYTRQLQARLASTAERRRAYGTSSNGEHVTFWIACGPDAWAWVRHRPHFLATLLPPGENPEDFNWDALRGHPPVLIVVAGAAAHETPERLAVSVLRDGGERVLVHLPNGESVRYVVEGVSD